jgi:hypothetical protein
MLALVVGIYLPRSQNIFRNIMKFLVDKFPENKDFEPDQTWTMLRESTNLWIIQLKALPFMVINAFMTILILGLLNISFHYNAFLMLFALVIIIPAHELIHALFFPGRLSSEQVVFGFISKVFAFYTSYMGELKRSNLITIMLAPLIIISLVGYLFLLIVGDNSLVEHIILANAVGSCADCLGVFLILRQVPEHAFLRFKEIRTYWRTES